ncbi:MAG: carbohydrate ABC transporter permease, partial [Candidatus Sumerlaeales bacterium]|nr:carbohydrate ABC transporter permease [Candidatus Sumerlaeales bacterium]
VSVATTVLVASLAAYPLARLEFFGKRIVFMFILCTLMVPFQLYMIPLFRLVTQDLRLANTYTGVILPFVASVFGIYLIKQFYETIPVDLDEAARVDGAGEFRLWWQILLPMTKPAMGTLAIFSFVGSWSNFLWPLLVLQADEKMTLPVQIVQLSGAFVDRISYLAAGSVIAIVPVILFFLFLQKWFLGGLTLGSVKG